MMAGGTWRRGLTVPGRTVYCTIEGSPRPNAERTGPGRVATAVAGRRLVRLDGVTRPPFFFLFIAPSLPGKDPECAPQREQRPSRRRV